jgi:hypothetical protein
MKRITVFALFTIAGFLTAGNALAQQKDVRVAVPFDFTVGDQLLPAGTYSIMPVSESTIEIRNGQTHSAVLTQASSDSRRSQHGGELVFNKYNGQYFLHEILCESVAMDVSLPTTKIEKRVRLEEARLHNDSSQVLLAVK